MENKQKKNLRKKKRNYRSTEIQVDKKVSTETDEDKSEIKVFGKAI